MIIKTTELTEGERYLSLVERNNRVKKCYRATSEELWEVVYFVDDMRQLYSEFYRGRIRRIAQAPRWRKQRPPISKLCALLGLSVRANKGNVTGYVKGSGAWGTKRFIPIDPDEKEFIEKATRPPEFAEYINAAIAEGYDPPAMPYDCWERYAEIREIRRRGHTFINGRESPWRPHNGIERAGYVAGCVVNAIPKSFYGDLCPDF